MSAGLPPLEARVALFRVLRPLPHTLARARTGRSTTRSPFAVKPPEGETPRRNWWYTFFLFLSRWRFIFFCLQKKINTTLYNGLASGCTRRGSRGLSALTKSCSFGSGTLPFPCHGRGCSRAACGLTLTTKKGHNGKGAQPLTNQSPLLVLVFSKNMCALSFASLAPCGGAAAAAAGWLRLRIYKATLERIVQNFCFVPRRA